MMESTQTTVTRSAKTMKILIDLIWYLSWAASLLALVLIVAAIAGLPMKGLQVKAPIQMTFENAANPGDVPMSQRPVITNIVGYATVLVGQAASKTQRLMLLVLLPILAGLIYGVYQLRQFFKNVNNGRPFDPDNPKRIRRIAYLIMAWGPFKGIFLYLQALNVMKGLSFTGGSTTPRFDLHLEFIFLGLVILVIAQIMDIGVKLQREQDLTV
jgi:hypothetical protein